MSPWLTFVIGVILGLLIGWIIDWWYRRRETTARAEPVETRVTLPPWTAPPVEAPVAPPMAAAPPVDVAPPDEQPSEPLPPVEAIPPTPAEPPEVVVPAVTAPVDAVPVDAVPVDAPEAPPLPEMQAPEAVVEVAELPEVQLPSAAVEPPATVALAAAVEPVDWPAVGGLPQAAVTVPVDAVPVDAVTMDAVEAPSAAAHIADEVPMTIEGLPPTAVEALTPNAAEVELPATPVRGVGGRDKLIVIEGIGPVYEKKLNAAGINTFRELMEASEEQLRAIIQPQSWQRVIFEDWVEQARLIVEGKDEELKALQARLFSRKKG